MSNLANNQRMANLANAKLTADLTSSATSVTVDDASVFPSPTFYATLMPGDEMSNENNSEIVKVTAVNSNTFTIARAQRGTTARAFATGSVLTNGSYIEDLEYAQSVGRTAFNTSYLNGVYTITTNTDMLPSTPEDGMRITIKVNTDSAGTPGLDLRGNGSIYSIYTGVQFNEDYYNDPAVLYSGKMYDLEFNNGSWYATNVAAQITADDMDDTYAGTFAYLSGNQVTPSSNVFVYTNNIDDGAVTSDKLDWTTIADVVTNSNGTAIKFGNGIMICYKTFESGDLTTDATYGATVWNFPATFIDTPTVLTMPTRGSGDFGVYIPRVHMIDVSYAQFIWTNINNTPAAGVSLYTTGHYAIGRWK